MIYKPSLIEKRHPLIEGIIVAILMIILVFPDVIFNEGSLRITDQIFGYKVSSLFELPRTTGWWGGYNDNGGASFQSEPMMEFMENVISSGQSPYWNPYASGGALGPETLVDQKFSLFTMLYAVFGGGSDVYNTISIGLYFFSLLFMYLVIRDVLKLSILSSIAGCVFFLLNGFSVANISSNIIQSYLYIPMCIYFSLLYLDKSTSVRIVGVITSFAILLSCTFMPTTITSFLAIYTVIIGYLFSTLSTVNNCYKIIFKCMVQHVVLVVFSVLLMSFLYFPIFESLLTSGSISDYSKRIFFPLFFPQAIASFYSPSHFFESYNAMEPRALYWIGSRSFPGNTVYHIGVISMALAGCALFSKNYRFQNLVITSFFAVMLVLFRMFDVEPISFILSKIPVFGTLGAHYWWPAIVIPIIFLVSFGVENLKNNTACLMPVLLILLIGIGSLFYVYREYGLQEPNVNFKVNSLYIIVFLFLFSATLIIISKFKKTQKYTQFILIVLVLGMIVELFYSSKMMRLQRNDYFLNPHGEIAFLKDNVQFYRTMNLGQTGLKPELGSAFQIQEITSMNQGVLPDFLSYYYSAINLDISQRFGYHISMMPNGAFPTTLLVKDDPAINNIDINKISLLGVKYIIIPAHYKNYAYYFESSGLEKVFDSPTAYIFENKKVTPRAFIIKTHYLNNELYLNEDYEVNLKPVNISRYENAKVRVSGYSESGGMVILTDNFHKNWSATFNGKKVKIDKINGLFRGVLVSKGDFDIEMTYEPKTLIAAKVITLILVLVLVSLLLFRRRVDSMLNKFQFGITYVS
ncbi:YfhO family protein [Vibrio anguillarum]|uniref:YfhO family protein n=1 Tax=Vibrio anguillarum TaxID=55601 RepID=UPI003D09E806